MAICWVLCIEHVLSVGDGHSRECHERGPLSGEVLSREQVKLPAHHGEKLSLHSSFSLCYLEVTDFLVFILPHFSYGDNELYHNVIIISLIEIVSK